MATRMNVANAKKLGSRHSKNIFTSILSRRTFYIVLGNF
ncbi:hypothetical protein COLO4_09193 [Corchorus olitorius]|uniref:Uncharacterized protein n=1 Tax=Corchorus olitorius TaxID=93759 RepID=A0A1R3KD18_9ROSI|nr:hypothetical protein COLO4_09193 [Corchorus olitorius]